MQSSVHYMFKFDVLVFDVMNLFNTFLLILNWFGKVSKNTLIKLEKHVCIHPILFCNLSLSVHKLFHTHWSSELDIVLLRLSLYPLHFLLKLIQSFKHSRIRVIKHLFTLIKVDEMKTVKCAKLLHDLPCTVFLNRNLIQSHIFWSKDAH